ncbi:MAG: carbohydrate binding family 9 domain-containing protein [Phycisphaerae bacterium]|nr:carbohydrate binding family 9 domain-containing protein [Saprospiraceae bacterium]
MKSSSLICLFLLEMLHLSAQNNADNYQLRVKKATVVINLDGALDEAAWQTGIEKADHFILSFPNDTAYSPWPTQARMTFDDHNLYVGIICHQRRSDYTVQSLRRDYAGGTTDAVSVMFDPSKDGLNGFIFSVSPLNVQREGLISTGEIMSLEWDNKWYSAVQNFDEYWTVEIAIPFKTLRYNVSEGENSWGLQFIRAKVKDFEASIWAPVPFQFSNTNLSFIGRLIWDTPPPKPGANISLIPYAIGGASLDYLRDDPPLEVKERKQDWTGGLGGDAKIGLTPGLNLDLTINPDFSQVEVDRQVANLSRFELFFPETRQFFLENRDLFAMYGFPETRPFFSRRVGLAYNPVTGQNQKVPILAGARLSGKLTDALRIGLLNMQTKRLNWDSTSVLPAANFSVATLQQKVFSRSIMSGFLVNKQNFLEDLNETQRGDWQPWNRVAGLEYNLYSKDNRWEGEAYYHRSFSPVKAQRGSTAAVFLGYRDRYFNANLGYMRVDSTYYAEAGFVPRTGVQGLYPGIGYRVYPKNGWAARHVTNFSFGSDGSLTFGLNNKNTDRDVSLYASMNFIDQSAVNAAIFNGYVYLFEPFDPSNSGQAQLDVGGYNNYGVRAEYFTGTSNDWQGSTKLVYRGFFNGTLFSNDGYLSYRWQPVGRFSIQYSYNQIRLPEPYASTDFWLVGPRVELSFRRDLFLSAFMQYNTQYNNFNLNARIQWRFAPVSDVFLVYTDNSYAEQIPNSPIKVFAPKNKAVVLKVVYWLNL